MTTILGQIGIGQFLLGQSWQLAILCVLICLTALVNAAEAALFSLSRGQLLGLSQDARKLHRLVAQLMKDPSGVLTAVLLGVNITQIVYFVLSSLLVLSVEAQVVHGAWWAPAVAATTFLAMVLPGEVLPKTAAFLAPLRIAPLVAPMMVTLVRLARPVHRLLGALFVEPLTRLLSPARPAGPFRAEEVASLLALSQKRGLIAPDQSELLREVLELAGLQAGDVMVPRVDMVAYPIGGDRLGLLQLIRQRRLTKIPLYEHDLDHVVGIVHVKRLLLEEQASPRELVTPVQFVPRTAPLERVLLQFRATGSTLAIIVDEYGGTAGLLTLETVVEEIVGDIADAREAHGPSPVTQVEPDEWLVEGDLPVHEWAEAFRAQMPGLRFSTVGGLVVSLLGHIPSVGETAQYRNLQLTIEAMRRRRVTLVRVRLVEKP